MPLNEVLSITVSFKREFFSFCGKVTKYTVENSHFCCLKELGHAVSLKVRQRDMLLLLPSWEMWVGILWEMKFIPHISVVQLLTSKILYTVLSHAACDRTLFCVLASGNVSV